MKYLILDRDGTINKDIGRVQTPEEMELLPNVIEGLQRFRDAGMTFFIVTNQGAIGRGKDTIENFDACQKQILRLLKDKNIAIERTQFCPHAPTENCGCRKPDTGMWDSLRAAFPGLSPADCLMVGDKDADVRFGKNIGCKTARIVSDKYAMDEAADYTVSDLLELSHLLLD